MKLMKYCAFWFCILLLAMACANNEECALGYEGETCSQETTPRIIRATSILLSNVPSYRSDGTPWDSTGSLLPDPFIEVNDFGFSGFIEDLDSSELATFENADFALSLSDSTYISIYDNDTEPSDPDLKIELIASYGFNAYTAGFGFPDTLNVGYKPKIQILLDYTW